MNIDKRVTGKTKLLGVIGNPIEHSISPELHNTISSFLKKDFIYVPFKIQKENLKDAIVGFKAQNFIGFNITIPYKQDIIPFLDEISVEAKLIGAVNTVYIKEGRLYGHNTDARGFIKSFEEQAQTSFKGKNVTIIGAGGASRAIAVITAMEGADKVSIINRTKEKAEDICEILRTNLRARAFSYSSEDSKILEVYGNSDVIINCTPIGMYPNMQDCPIEEKVQLHKNQIVYDTIYNPTKTILLKRAEEQGCTIINGLGMLFYQGVYAYQLWTETEIDDICLKELYSAYLNILKEKTN